MAPNNCQNAADLIKQKNCHHRPWLGYGGPSLAVEFSEQRTVLGLSLMWPSSLKGRHRTEENLNRLTHKALGGVCQPTWSGTSRTKVTERLNAELLITI